MMSNISKGYQIFPFINGIKQSKSVSESEFKELITYVDQFMRDSSAEPDTVIYMLNSIKTNANAAHDGYCVALVNKALSVLEGE